MQGLVLGIVVLMAVASLGHSHTMLAGGYTEERPPSEREILIAASVKGKVIAAVNGHCESNCFKWADYCDRKALNGYKVVSVRSQVVAGTNYLFKIEAGKNRYIAVKVFNPLPLLVMGAPASPEFECVAPYEGRLDPKMCDTTNE